MNRKCTIRIFVTAGLLLGLAACALSPGGRLDETAGRLGWVADEVTAGGFRLRVYFKGRVTAGARLRVYLEGDGRPWLGPGRVARDPTTRNPVALELMRRDPGPAVYLGRPCYHRMDGIGRCSPWYWTAGRYSAEVVDALAEALESIARDWPADVRIGLVGYSGGGSLAMLMAERSPRIDAVISVAGNHDPDAWIRHHGYSPLTGSLNPALSAPLRGSIRQLHLLGEKDANVPARLVEPKLLRQPGGWLVKLRDFDHACCWPSIWHIVLEAQDRGLSPCALARDGMPAMTCRNLHELGEVPVAGEAGGAP